MSRTIHSFVTLLAATVVAAFLSPFAFADDADAELEKVRQLVGEQFDMIEPEWCVPSIWVDGNPAMYDAGLGWYYPIGSIVVSTPLPHGNSYSDIVTVDFMWEVCYGVRIYAFSDENYNLIRDGNECFSAYSHDTTVPVEEKTWGAIKALYTE